METKLKSKQFCSTTFKRM